VHEIKNARERLTAIAVSYVQDPESTLVVSPDNVSRTQINSLIREQLQEQGKVSLEQRPITVLSNRHELTGADRQWAARYEIGDVIRYTRGSQEQGVSQGEYATVAGIDSKANLLNVRRQSGEVLTYDPKRLYGVNVYRQEKRDFSAGDRIQFTAPLKAQRIANRQLGRVERLDDKGDLRIRLDSGRTVEFNIREHPHLDYGYAVTSHSSQGQTADRVLVHVSARDAENRQLVNRRFAYVALSRGRYGAEIYTNDASGLAASLDREISKRAAVEIDRPENRISPAVPKQEKQTALEQIIA